MNYALETIALARPMVDVINLFNQYCRHGNKIKAHLFN